MQGLKIALQLLGSLPFCLCAPVSLQSAGQIPVKTGRLVFFERLSDCVAENFYRRKAHIFISAAGIAVRAIAPLLVSKRTDPAVLLLDQSGRHVISLLSGHLGGANALARQVAEILGAEPVITTATDLEDLPAIDLIAGAAGLASSNPEVLGKISAALLAGRKVNLFDPENRLGLIGGRWEDHFRVLARPPDAGEYLGEFAAVDASNNLSAGQSPPGTVWRPRFAGKSPRCVSSAKGIDDRLHSNELKCNTPKFLKNKRSPIFQKIAGGGFATSIPIRFLSKANWDETPAIVVSEHLFPSDFSRNVLRLHPPLLYAGIGCRRGTPAPEIRQALIDVLLVHGLAAASLAGIACISAKSGEKGLLAAAEDLGLPLEFFSPAELSAFPVTSPSAKALEVFGIAGVCESAALASAAKADGVSRPETAVLVVPKQIRGRVTVAVAKTKIS
ncbi:MAG: cobalamin biosynthesis protein [Desulfovibrio sp.]|nr:cobalamin biosynthesis protein [Desulfovibrio sp.]